MTEPQVPGKINPKSLADYVETSRLAGIDLRGDGLNRIRNLSRFTEGAKMKLISREELKEKLDRGDDFKLVMVLKNWAFRAKHIRGSIYGYRRWLG